MLSEYTRYSYTISILGDLNFKDIRWNVEPPEADSMLSIALLEYMIAWNMTQIVTQPTWVKNVLDVIITKSPAIYTECHNMPAVGKSNHDIVTCQIITRCCAARNGGVCKRINYDALQLQLSSIGWRALMANAVDADDLWRIFHDVLSTAIRNCTQMPYRVCMFVCVYFIAPANQAMQDIIFVGKSKVFISYSHFFTVSFSLLSVNCKDLGEISLW